MTSRSRILALALVAQVALGVDLDAQSLLPGRPEEVGLSAERLDRIGRVMQEQVDRGRIAGAVMLVARRGKVAYHQAVGWADREAGNRMTTDAIFRIASQTKAITSVAIMMLVEEGKLGLTDPVSRVIPEYARTTVAVATDHGRSIVPAKRQITIRDLLTHTAGISYGTDSLVADLYQAKGLGPAAGFGWYTADKTEPICVTMERLASLPFVAQPGERWVYGYNTDILGCVVERASGLPLDRFVREHIAGPLRMEDTFFYLPPDRRARLATVYASGADGKLLRAPAGAKGQGDYVDGPRQSFAGGAGLLATAADYGRFLQMLLNGGELDGVRLLSPKTVQLMTANHTGTLYSSDAGFGLGFEIQETLGRISRYGTPGAFGWGGAYSTSYWVDPAEQLVGVFMVQAFPFGGGIGEQFRTLVYQAIVEAAR